MAETACVWVLSDGRTGNEKPARALAERLGRVERTLRLEARAPWRWLAPRRLPGTLFGLGDALAVALRDGLPELAVGCGRQAALATRLLRLRGARVVQLLDPRLDPRHWDLVVAPAHDRLRGANVIATEGSLHSIDDAWLAQARADWPALGTLPSPRTSVLLGGPTREVPFTRADWRRLEEILHGWLDRDGGSLLVSSSGRTPPWLRAAARSAFDGVPGLQWHGEEDGANPYPGLLGWAERLVVGADSVNLLSEACGVGVPVYSPLPTRPRGRIAAFHRALREHGRVHPLTAAADAAAPAPLRELGAVAVAVRRKLGLPAPTDQPFFFGR